MFTAKSVPPDVVGRDYYLDLLAYQARLRGYVVVNLKMGDFEPEFAHSSSSHINSSPGPLASLPWLSPFSS
ncbi:PDDEXK nuclease domain-containing protein [Bradyrhizobium brasilense]|uniref:PDDEXK nuclease domain-containing protein n=1 Tax=Bradyrhizobium brasilense TaxID=1419277 RepID=UPI003B967CC2